MRAKKWLVAAGALLLSGALVTGVAVAATTPERVAHNHHGGKMTKRPSLDELVKQGKITQGQAEVMAQIQALHQKAMEQLKTDAKAVIDQAIKDGKITQEQADQLKAKRLMMGVHHGKRSFQKGPKTEAELKALLDEKVKAGRLTQEQADRFLQKWQERHSAKPSLVEG